MKDSRQTEISHDAFKRFPEKSLKNQTGMIAIKITNLLCLDDD